MIQKVCAVFDLCGLGLVFDGSKRAASFGEVCVIPVRHCREARYASDANAIAQLKQKSMSVNYDLYFSGSVYPG